MILSKSDYRFYLQQDRTVNGVAKKVGIVRNIKNIILPSPIWQFITTLRKVEYLTNCKKGNCLYAPILLYYRWKLHKRSIRLGFSIPINVFGPGLSIPHYGTIVVNPNAKVGANCRLHVGVNIGASAGGSAAPQIGDNVYIGPGAILFGDVSIARNVTIGANATVNRSCEQENVVLAGTPARIVKENTESWIMFNHIDQ